MGIRPETFQRFSLAFTKFSSDFLENNYVCNRKKLHKILLVVVGILVLVGIISVIAVVFLTRSSSPSSTQSYVVHSSASTHPDYEFKNSNKTLLLIGGYESRNAFIHDVEVLGLKACPRLKNLTKPFYNSKTLSTLTKDGYLIICGEYRNVIGCQSRLKNESDAKLILDEEDHKNNSKSLENSVKLDLILFFQHCISLEQTSKGSRLAMTSSSSRPELIRWLTTRRSSTTGTTLSLCTKLRQSPLSLYKTQLPFCVLTLWLKDLALSQSITIFCKLEEEDLQKRLFLCLLINMAISSLKISRCVCNSMSSTV